MDLKDLVDGIPGFAGWSHADKIRFFAWFIHPKRGRERFKAADIGNCYDELHMEPPSAIGPFLTQMENRKPKEALKNPLGYALEGKVRSTLDQKYGHRPATVMVDRILADLPNQVPDLAERTFLDETIRCFRAGAFRATIVMAWNLSYHHLCDFVLRKYLVEFNAQWPKSMPKHYLDCRIKAIGAYDDFGELKESQVVQICRLANIINNDLRKILDEKLGKRNSAAHPSSVTIAPHTAEEYIIDLVNNVVLKLS